MTTTFPTAIDDFVTPLPTDKLNLPSHSGLHNHANEAIVAVQEYVGIESDATAATLTGRVKALEAGGVGQPGPPGPPGEPGPPGPLNPLADAVRDQNSVNYVKDWIGTQAQYNALGTYNATTFYTITDAPPAGGGGTGGSVDWSDVLNKPATFPPSAHSHAIADTTGLQTALDGKANASHTHTIANVTGLQTALDGKLGATQVAVGVNDTGAGASLQFWFGTEAQYTAIVTKDPSTVYLRSA